MDEVALRRLPAVVAAFDEARGQVERYRDAAQDGVDVTLAVVGADGAARITVDSPNGQWGEEWLLFPAGDCAGDVLEIRPLTAEDTPGCYRLSVGWSPPAEARARQYPRPQGAASRLLPLHHRPPAATGWT